MGKLIFVFVKFLLKVMKILLINVHYGLGSTGKIVASLYKFFKSKGDEVYCLYGRKSSTTDDNHIIKKTIEFESKVHHFFANFTGNLYGGLHLSTLLIKRYISKIKPDIVNLHCINGYFVNVFSLIRFLKRKKIKTVLTNHAEFMYTGNCGHSFECRKWLIGECKGCKRNKEFNKFYTLNLTHIYFKKMMKAFRDFDCYYVTNVSPWLTERSSASPIMLNARKNITICNPIDSLFFDNKDKINPYFKEDKKIVFWCTASMSNHKGGHFFWKFADMCSDLNIHFYVKSLEPASQNDAVTNVTIIQEKLSQKELANYYRYADCSILLSKAETFSMTLVESLATGTPVVGFSSGGPETISPPDCSFFVPYGDLLALKKQLKEVLYFKKFDRKNISQLAYKAFNEESVGGKYRYLFDDLIRTYKK